MKKILKGLSYKQRIITVTTIYDTYARSGMSNRDIHRRYIYPLLGITERTMYNLLKAGASLDTEKAVNDHP